MNYRLSLVIPCFNEEKAVPIFYDEFLRLEFAFDIDIEIWFIDDGSNDNTLNEVKKIKQKDRRIHYISFSRNFGKEAALFAGLEAASGDFIATMDVDLQDPPALLPEMLKMILADENMYDCIATRRTTRTGEPRIRAFFAKLFYKIINRMSSTQIMDGARDYRLMSRKMADAVIKDRECNRFSKGIYSWVGFNTKWIAYENIERSIGSSKWSFGELFRYSIEGILAYSTVPLSMASVLGICMCFFSFVALFYIIIKALIFGNPVAGWPSLVSIITFLGGLILFHLGIMGLYLSKIYLETKNRQIYIIKEKE